MSLPDSKIRTAKPSDKNYKLTDGAGLYLEVRTSGTKLWRYRYRIAGKENLFAIGEYGDEQPKISLADARTAARAARALVKQGIHPSHDRKLSQLATHNENANTFEAVAVEWIERTKTGSTDYYRKQIERVFKADVFPVVGKLPIRKVTAAHILKIIRSIEARGAPMVAANARQWCSAVFCYGVATLRLETDPAAALKGAITRPKPKHAKALSPDETKLFLKGLQSYGGYRTTVIALNIILLTFVRTIELRQAEWSEFNLEKSEWRIPARRMKMKEQHLVPLSKQVVKLLVELKTFTGGRTHLFPNLRNPQTCMTNTTLNRALERMGLCGKDGIGFSAHGFRATASTMLHEAGYPTEVIERQLAHADRNKVRAAYDHAEYLPQRRTMMQEWADKIDDLAMPQETSLPV
jgi:integrase